MKTLRKTMTVLAVIMGLAPLAQTQAASAHSSFVNPGSVNMISMRLAAQPLQGGFPAGGGKPAPTPTPRPKPVGPPKSGDE